MPSSHHRPPLPDTAARERALLDFDTTLLVEAGAGSGKTALMAGRVALMLAHDIPARDIVAITEPSRICTRRGGDPLKGMDGRAQSG